MLVMMGGMQMQMIARGYLAYELTSSPFLLGVVNSGFAVPLLALSLFGGAFADRLERKYIIQFGQAMSAALAILIGVAIHFDVVAWYHLWAASIIQGGLFSFLMPARQAIIPQLVGQERLSNAMALNAAAMSATTLAAPAVAGWAYAYLGAYNVYYIIAGLAVIAFAMTGLIPRTGTGAGRRPAPMIGDIIEGLVYIRRSPLVLILLLMGLATALLAMPFRFLMPIFVVDVYRMGPEAMGLLVTIMGGGIAGRLVVHSVARQEWKRNASSHRQLHIGSDAAACGDHSKLSDCLRADASPRAGRRGTAHAESVADNGGGRGQVQRARDERLHAELWPDAAWSTACGHGGRVHRRSGGCGDTSGDADRGDGADSGYAKAAERNGVKALRRIEDAISIRQSVRLRLLSSDPKRLWTYQLRLRQSEQPT